ncbi:hypothetical protein GKG47_09090 [Lactonifactor sp. BIOML-A3]|uniref:hypothetical protein n=1 Tax=unclassified Lactonifactor TaxID=2636670 RepID=UPI0012B11884|nr:MULTISPECIES: hypothetical protein [unclassified Lactonifactor]MSA02193.1 hypothetical protein [Lactonifactor sp. BIOML-A5]MSA07978.1 hypothetical protein [Lactonifactor sp. BIOML-A4]MSA12594.1 hypothetical protein [Lactonifactor sp. BIOML-A3]MSA16705.1 hypothetical protein [Lactonifactor sp. BIOML-A2]MSA37596.1 hypothetical protein [Lactonifactor sp. BIOML-A1]
MKNNLKNVRITGGMTGEYEIFETDAPPQVIEEQLRIYSNLMESGKKIDPYSFIEGLGYSVNIIGCQDDDDLEVKIDMEYDCYDY